MRLDGAFADSQQKGDLLAGMIARWISEPILSSIGLQEDVAKAIRYILSLAAMLFAYYRLFSFYEKRKVTELSKQYILKDTLLGIALGSLAISVVILVLYLAGYYRVVSINSNALLLLFPLTAFTLTATLEELIFRGVLYRIVESKLGTNLALIISGSIFGFLHLSNEHATMVSVLGVGIGGVIAGMMFSVTKRLWLPISFHAIWNFMQVFYGGVNVWDGRICLILFVPGQASRPGYYDWRSLWTRELNHNDSPDLYSLYCFLLCYMEKRKINRSLLEEQRTGVGI